MKKKANNDNGVNMSKMMDSLLGGDSSIDERFKYEVGDTVKVTLRPEQEEALKAKTGLIGKILNRRNGYPPPEFEGYWFPLYYVEGLGEIGEGCVEKQ